MVIVPSLDVRAARLSDGLGQTVVARARDLVVEGAEELHFVDLDRAETGESTNLDLLAGIARTAGVPCRLAGGISRVGEARRAIVDTVLKMIAKGEIELQAPDDLADMTA